MRNIVDAEAEARFDVSMDSVASQVPPSPLPDRAWNGRSWWFSCCSGCLLVLLLVAAAFFLVGGWSATLGAKILQDLQHLTK